jgi:UPF0755 protein
MRKLLMGLGLATLVASACAVYVVHAYLDSPAAGSQTAQVEVKRGARLRSVLNDLAHAGVLRRPSWLYAYARLCQTTQVRSGTYSFAAEMSPRQVLATLAAGQVVLEQFTVAEGLNRWQIRDLLAQGHWLTVSQFDALCDDKGFLQANHVPGPTCEGYLYPETYKLARGVTPSAILQMMFAAYRQRVALLTAAHGGHLALPLGLNERQMVTLASIVEKETGAPQERPRIACVFYNRLKAKPPWRMETDPTVIYAATLSDPNFNGNLTRHHLHELDNPYNTYRVYGLPPGPIASPGAAALQAVAEPAACGDYFFVSSNNGQHIFCPTLQCHEAAVKKWQVDFFRHPRSPKGVAAPPPAVVHPGAPPHGRVHPAGHRAHQPPHPHGHAGH